MTPELRGKASTAVRFRLLLRLVGIYGLLLGLAFASSAAEGPNLLENAGFTEVRADGTPAGWRVNLTPETYRIAVVDSDRVQGEKALHLSGSERSGRAFIFQGVPVEEGERFVLRFWHRTDGPLLAGEPFRYQARVEFLNELQSKLIAPQLFVNLPHPADAWTYVEHVFEVPVSREVDADGERMPVKYIWVHLRLDNAVGDVYFTGVELRKLTPDSFTAQSSDEVTVMARTLYVSPEGDDANPGSREAPWRTLSKASREARAGDTVYLLPGTYEGILQPEHGGTPEAPVRFVAEEPLSVLLIGSRTPYNHAVHIEGVAHVYLEGLRIQPQIELGRWLLIDNAYDVRVSRFFMEGGSGDSGLGRTPLVIRNSQQIQLRDSVMREFTGHDMAHVYNSERILFEGNAISRTGHSPLAFSPRIELFGSTHHVVLRGNVFHANWGRNFEIFGESDFLFEGNIITEAFDGGLSADPQAKFLVDGGIARFNRIFRNWGIPVSGSPYHDNLHFRNVYFYNNVFDQNQEPAFFIASHHNTENVHFKNNIFSFNNALGAGTQISFGGNLGTAYRDLEFRRNVFIGQDGPGWILSAGLALRVEHLQSEAWRRVMRQAFFDNLEVDPGYAAPERYDHSLGEDSPLRDAGAPLTYAVGSGEGTRLVVQDAGYFYDGFGILGEVGDTIAVGTTKQSATVLQVDREQNVLILDRPVVWQDGDPVSLPWSGSGPDIGAYEHGPDGRISIHVDVEPFFASPGESVTLRAVIHGTMEPEEFIWHLGDGTIIRGGEQIEHVYTSEYDYPVRVRVTEKGGRSFVGVGYVVVEEPDRASRPLLYTTFDAEDTDWWWLWYKSRPTPVDWERILDDATGDGALRIRAPEDGSVMPLNTHPKAWNIDEHPYVYIRYRLTPGTPYILYLQGFGLPGDTRRVVVAASPAAVYTESQRVAELELVDDGDWHELRFDARLIRAKYPDLQILERLGFEASLAGRVKQGAEFWLDEAAILPAW